MEEASNNVRRKHDTSGRKAAVASASGNLRMVRMNCMISSESDGSLRAKAKDPNVWKPALCRAAASVSGAEIEDKKSARAEGSSNRDEAEVHEHAAQTT